MKGRGTELYLFAVQLRNVIVFPNFSFFSSLKSCTSGFVFIWRRSISIMGPGKNATMIIYCIEAWDVYMAYMNDILLLSLLFSSI